MICGIYPRRIALIEYQSMNFDFQILHTFRRENPTIEYQAITKTVFITFRKAHFILSIELQESDNIIYKHNLQRTNHEKR